MKKKLFGLLVIALSLVCITSISAADTDDGLWSYALYGDGVALTAYHGSATDVFVPSNIEVDGEKLDVVKLGDGIFENNDSLNSVTIGAGITEIGEKAFYDADNMVCVLTSEELTTIGDEALRSCDNLNSIILESAITTVGTDVFLDCPKLTVWCEEGTVGYNYLLENGIEFELIIENTTPTIIKDGPVTYYVQNGEAIAIDCDHSVTEVVLPATVEGYPVVEIRDTFKGCILLETVVLPNSLRTISRDSFYACEKLVSVNIPESVTFIGQSVFTYCISLESIEIPDSVKFMDFHVFTYCEKLKSVKFPSGIATIPAETFYGCISLETIVIPDTVTSIAADAFYDCRSLRSVTLPDGLKEIGERAFYKCSALDTIIVPESVETVSAEKRKCSFAQNTVVLVAENSYLHTYAKKVEFDANYERILYYVYDGTSEPTFEVIDGVSYYIQNGYAYAVDCDESLTDVTVVSSVNGYNVIGVCGAFTNNKTVKTVNLPMTITFIGYSAFENSTITAIDLPSSVTRIRCDAFANCKKLAEVNLPEKMIYIGSHAFYGCEKLESIVIPTGLGYLHDNTFYKCTSLASLTIPSDLHTIYGGVFGGCSSLTHVELPEGVREVYQTAFRGCKNLRTILLPKSITTLRTTSFTENTICMVYEDSFAHQYAVENELLYFVYDGTNMPEIIEEDGICYYVNNSGNAVAIDADETIIEAVIPATVNGYPVKELCYTFKDSQTLKSVVISEGIELIGNYAFADSTLESVVIPSTVTRIGFASFGSCIKLKEVTLPASLEIISTYAFHHCDSLTSLVIPESVTQIRESAFEFCVNLEDLTLPATDIVIGDKAFFNCPKLITVVVPSMDATTYPKSFTISSVIVVFYGSNAYNTAVENNLMYFIARQTENPEISYGTGITGTVTYTDGSAASGATVEILYDDGTVKEEVTTDANGAYAFTYAEVGQYTIRATDENGNTSTTTASVKRMNVFDVFVSGDTNLTLKQGWTVSGTVSENVATVTITDEDGNVIETVETTDGAFAYGNIPNGTYVVTATSESGSISQEITVYNANISGITLILPTVSEAATIWGYVEVEDRDKKHTRRNWVEVTVYNTEGIAVGQTKTDADGKYTFANLPLGEYTIVAETAEMRPDKKHGFDRSHTLTGYAYVNATEATTYQVETIVLYEENDSVATIAGKVTAEGETQDCEVILRNVFRHEIAKQTTGKNGKYSFVNVRDGLYFIIATTNSDGMGMAVVVVRDGKVYGETDIKVSKKDFIREQESKFIAEITCNNRDEVLLYRERIADEKRFYDSLSEKEKKQLSKDYIQRLEQYVAWLAEVDYTAPEGVIVEQGGLVVSGDELEKEETVSFNLTVEKQEEYVPSTDGVKNEKDHKHHKMKDTAGNKEIKEYYEIKMTKNTEEGEKEITSVRKDTDANGKFRITMEIPEEYRGYKNYTMLHEHHGEVVTLVDLDDDPNTITFEVDKFSTFALAVSNEETVGDTSDEVTPSEPVCDINGDGKMNVADVLAVAKAVLNKQTSAIYDTNKDGRISLVDVLCIMKMIVA